MANEDLYADKSRAYFTGERRDIIDRLPRDSARAILEIGCGDGATGAYARATGKCGHYVGLELTVEAAELASSRLDAVHVANVETFDPPFADHQFDVIIASEVLEHLVDPWRVLAAYRRYLKPGGRVFASSPNVAHKAILRMLLTGRWDLTADGVMDRSHLRWFTPGTYAEMFEDSGYRVKSVSPMSRSTRRAALFNLLTANRFSHLFITQMLVEAEAPSTTGAQP